MSVSEVFSIGHSTLPFDRFLAHLRSHEITAIADVRSSPMSQHFPQFNRDTLRGALANSGIAYVFLGAELGGRPREAKLYTDGIADYEKMSATSEFHEGLDRVVGGAQRYRIALMCSEHDPLDCHRCLLVARALKARGIVCSHVLSDGSLASQIAIERRLLDLAEKHGGDLFASHEQQLADAYRNRARKVAYRNDRNAPPTKYAATG